MSALHAEAGSATWSPNPSSGFWNVPTNWTPNTIPDGSNDVATFATSNTTAVSIKSPTKVDRIVFNPGASAFSISAVAPPILTIDGAGVVNNSGTPQNFICDSASGRAPGLIAFTGSASAGSLTVFTCDGHFDGSSITFSDSASAATASFTINGTAGSAPGKVVFLGTATAGSATFLANGSLLSGGDGGAIEFHDTSAATAATLTTESGGPGFGGEISFFDTSSAAECTITNNGPSAGEANAGSTSFQGSSTGGSAQITNAASSSAFESGGETAFEGDSTACNAGEAVIVNRGSSTPNASGGETDFYRSGAGTATITSEGGTVAGALGGLTLFAFQSDAQDSTLIANGGVDAASAGAIRFENDSVGGTARVILSGNGKLDLSNHSGPLTIGSAEGEGEIFLGKNPLAIGSSNLSTQLGAIVQDGGLGGGVGGSLSKVGTGVLTLTGANSYTGGTQVSAGALLVSNLAGSGTGTGAVTLTAGTLGGSGTISGAVSVGSGAFLAPAGRTHKPATLSVGSAVTFNGNSSYVVTFQARRAQTKYDALFANGVSIEGATFSLSGRGTLSLGTVLTVINNTSATPIAGTFSNLPDGAIVSVNGNNFQANYEGGDGNDLTLTVVP